jgi:hypothetical protein
MMTQRSHAGKKEPRYLEDITLTVDSGQDVVRPGYEEDLFASGRFLGMYDEKRILSKLKKVGMMEILAGRGYRNFRIHITKQDNYTSRLYVDSVDTSGDDTRLIELIVREGVFRPRKSFVPGFDFQEGLSMLLIEWLSLQDPKSSFLPGKPRLPGQQYPGLGGLKNMQELLYSFGRSLGKDAIIDIPEYYHAAVIYSRMYSEIYSRKYSFFSPVDAGKLNAIMRDFPDVPLSEVSFAVTFDCLLDARTGEQVQWKPSEQIYPISHKLHRYFAQKEYKEILENTMNELSFTMDWEKYRQLKKNGVMDEV